MQRSTTWSPSAERNDEILGLMVTGSARDITCLLSGSTIVLVALHIQHDKACEK
jgi:hypothetical protein